MAYTRNTRIKVTKNLHSTIYDAQVEYVHPLTRLSKWVDITDAPYSNYPTLIELFCYSEIGSLPWQADRDCIQNEELDNTKGEEWAKAQINQYHELVDEAEYKPIVEYVKYP